MFSPEIQTFLPRVIKSENREFALCQNTETLRFKDALHPHAVMCVLIFELVQKIHALVVKSTSFLMLNVILFEESSLKICHQSGYSVTYCKIL